MRGAQQVRTLLRQRAITRHLNSAWITLPEIQPIASSSTHHPPIPARAHHGTSLRQFSTSSLRPESFRDRKIPYREVHVVQQDSSLGPLVPTYRVLRDTDLTTHTVVLVSEEPPIVKIINKEAEYKAERQRRDAAKAAKKLSQQEKEVQVSWNTADGDLETKLGHAKGHLADGNRVLLVFAPRGGAKKRQTSERMEHMVSVFDKGLEEIATKYKDDEFRGRVVTCFWKPQNEVSAAARSKVMERVQSEEKGKEQRREERRRRALENEQAAAKRKEEEAMEAARVLEERRLALEESARRQREKEEGEGRR